MSAIKYLQKYTDGKYTLPEIISEEQNCSVPNRTIFNNLFLIRDIIKYTKEKTIIYTYYK